MRINSPISVEHLRAVVSVAETASFTKSGRLLQLSQSSLSRRIADLERILKVQLFHRTTRSVQPTTLGRVMLEQMRETLVSFDQGIEELRRQASGESGVITVGCLPSIAASFLPRFIRDFSSEYPSVRVEVRDALTEEVLVQIRDGEVDFGITAVSSRDRDLSYERIGADTFYCALPEWHQLAKFKNLEWEMLRGERVIMFSSSSSISRPVTTSLETAGVDTDTTMVGHNVGAVAGLVASGLGITVIPGLVRPLMEFAQLVFVPLLPTAERPIFLIRRKGQSSSAAVKRFVEPMRQQHDHLK